MNDRDRLEEFSFLGGPLHQTGCRLGLVRNGGVNTLPLGIALGFLLWLVLLALTLIEGVGEQIFSLSVLGGHVRLLLAIPLFFVCESFVAPRMNVFVAETVRAGLIPRSALPALREIIARNNRWSASWLADATCLMVAAVTGLSAPEVGLSGISGTYDPAHLTEMTLTAQWYWFVCLTVFRFLILRWLWRLALWSFFLWKLSRLDLQLFPAHPDRAAGLGYLEVVQTEFVPLVLAISAVMSASLAEEIATGVATLDAAYPMLAIIFGVDALLFLGPLYIFAPRLWACRVNGLAAYTAFASSYVHDFDKKWLQSASTGEPLLGTADIQSLADLSNSFGVVREMRVVPIGERLLWSIAVAAVVPLLPLALLQYPIAELAVKVFMLLTGL